MAASARPVALALVLLALPVLALLLSVKFTRNWPIRYGVWIDTLGRTNDAFPTLVWAHIQSLPMGPTSVFVPDAVAQLQAHVEQGDQVVIATGCLQPLAVALLQHAGLGHLSLVASTLRSFLRGLVRDQHCFGANKVPMLSALEFSPPWAVAYTDHHADLPILQLSSECYLVGPKAACLARIEQALLIKPTVLNWR